MGRPRATAYWLMPCLGVACSLTREPSGGDRPVLGDRGSEKTQGAYASGGVAPSAGASGMGHTGGATGGCERAGIGSSGRVFYVGPGRPRADLGAVQGELAPGDVVEVDGDAAYPSVVITATGTADAPILFRGVPSGGRAPVISGGTNTVRFTGSHVVFDGFDVIGGEQRCVFHEADDITLCRTHVHDCPRHGILGADQGSGTLVLSQVEVSRCGGTIAGENLKHPIYVATDPVMYPEAVFRVEHSFIHDNQGGNAVKSRARRTELYENWIESNAGMYYSVELVGYEKFPAEPPLDSDVVGNVLVHESTWGMRFGGDGTGSSRGRVRFAFNTVVLAGSEWQADAPVFRFADEIDAFDAFDNVFFSLAGGELRLVRDDDAKWLRGQRTIGGSHNWVPTGSTGVPADWRATLLGVAPGFGATASVAGLDLVVTGASPLRYAGTADTRGTPGMEIAAPRLLPSGEPPRQRPASFASMSAEPRPGEANPTVGAHAAR